MTDSLKIPGRSEMEKMLEEAGERNPGPWIAHSYNVGRAAELIADRHPQVNPETAYIMGCLHDIGRREGVSGMRHTLDCYYYLRDKVLTDAALICLTHSFTIKKITAIWGKWDCSEEEQIFLAEFLEKNEYTVYDRLIQLCDCLASSTGFWLLEKRMIDVAMRYGCTDFAVEKWKGYFNIQKEFEEVIGCSIYELLPGVVENTFGKNLA
jgi:hypothetical protein